MGKFGVTRYLFFVFGGIAAVPVACLSPNQPWLSVLLALGMALGLSALAARWLGRRFVDLSAAVESIGRGTFDRHVAVIRPWEPSGFRQLGEQVRLMETRLKEHTEQLEELVLARTAEVEAANSQLRSLVSALERAEDGIQICNPEGRFLYVNPALCQFTGYSQSELIGNSPAVLRSGVLPESFYERIEAQVREGRVYRGEFAARRKDGTLFDQELTMWPTVDAQGKLTGIVGLRRDVSERSAAERALRLSERMASVGTLAAGVAHEVNNPLTYVLLSLHQLKRQLTRERHLPAEFARRALDSVTNAVEGSERVQTIVQDLRSFSRANDEELSLLVPEEVMESALRMASNTVWRGAHIVRSYDKCPKVLGNSARLGQVLLNLVVNAMHSLEQATGGDKRITVRTRTSESQQAVIEVEDSGVGIPEEDLEHIFDPFFTTKPVGVGTGLGLAVCHNIVSRMGGTLKVSSEVGHGACFRLTLPKARAGDALTPVPTSGPRCGARPSLEVLVIDDDAAVGRALKLSLAEDAVAVRQSGEDGLRLLGERHFDLILCDITMPEMSGFEFYRELCRRHPNYRQRVVLMTGGALSADTESFLQQGDVTWLEKPFSEEQLERSIQALLPAPTTWGAGGASA